MSEWLTQLYSYAMQIISIGNPQDLIAILSVAGLTEFGIPFPFVVDTLLFLMGYRIADLWFETIIIMLVLMAGRIIGSSLVYLLAHSLGSPLIHWLAKRFPNWRARVDNISRRLGLKTSLSIAISWIGSRIALTASATSFGFATPLTVASGRLTPGLLIMTSVASGILGLRYRYFALGIGIASILSDIATISFGAVTGYGLRQLNIDASSWMLLVIVVINIGMLILMQRFLWRRLAAKFA